MNILRKIEGFQLNEGNSMAKGLFNVSIKQDVSLWFDSDTKDVLMECDEDDFTERCEQLIKDSIID